MKTVARMASFVHDILSRAELRPAAASIVRSVLGGITATGSVVLSEILRPQVDGKKELRAAEQRVSHALKNDATFDQLPDAYRDLLAPVAHSMPYRSVDGSDLSKPASRKTEFLDVIRDGSAKPRTRLAVGPQGVLPASSVPWSATRSKKGKGRRRRPAQAKPRTKKPAAGRRRTTRPATPASRPQRPRTPARKAERATRKAERQAARAAVGEASPPAPSAVPPRAEGATKTGRVKFPSPPALKKLGYWMVQIVVSDGKGNQLPVAQDLFSTQDPSYQALGEEAWTKTFQLSIERVIKDVGRGGCWQMDRGFDDIVWMNWMSKRVDQYNLRLKGNRRVRPGTKEAAPLPVETFAETLAARHKMPIRYVDKRSHKEKSRIISFTWAPIWIDGVDHPPYLIVAHTGRKHPLLVVTNKRPENAEEAAASITAYLERWGNEEMTRACKQLTGLERIRVRSMAALRRMMWLAMIAVGLQALSILTCGRLTRATLDRAKEFIKTVRLVLYRIWRVVQGDILRALERRSPVLLS